MPHLSARFRRSKRPPTSHANITDIASSIFASPKGDGMLASQVADIDPPQPEAQDLVQTSSAESNDRPSSPPALSLTTVTTPPSSSHSNHSNVSIYSNLSIKSAPATKTTHLALRPLKSPFRGFLRANKRGRSPAPASLHLHAQKSVPGHVSPAMTGSSPLSGSFPASPTKAEIEWHDMYSSLIPKKRLPGFLTVSFHEIESKFTDLQWQERSRIVEGMREHSPTGRFCSALPMDARRLDRYQNIQPWTNNRVKLRVPEGRLDYINASPITVPSALNPEKRPAQNYIAMQGPKKDTMEHTWRMVVEQIETPAVIVMLTETHEAGHEKCYPYFPRTVEEKPIEIGQTDEFGDGFKAQVRCASVEELADGAIEMRKVVISVQGQAEEKIVWHLLYRRWPDFGVPAMEDIDSFLELIRLSREKNVNPSNPRIVHCSAGVGRSGTFITLDNLMREVESGDLENYDDDHSADLIFNTVNSLREQRRVMVQSDSQYLFIYQVLRQQWYEKYGSVEAAVPSPMSLNFDAYRDPFFED